MNTGGEVDDFVRRLAAATDHPEDARGISIYRALRATFVVNFGSPAEVSVPLRRVAFEMAKVTKTKAPRSIGRNMFLHFRHPWRSAGNAGAIFGPPGRDRAPNESAAEGGPNL